MSDADAQRASVEAVEIGVVQEDSDAASDTGVLSGTRNVNSGEKAYKAKVAALEESELWWRRAAIALALCIGAVAVLAVGAGLGWWMRGKNANSGEASPSASPTVLRPRYRPLPPIVTRPQLLTPPTTTLVPYPVDFTLPAKLDATQGIHLSEENGAYCPTGTTPLTSVAACQQAAEVLHKKFVYTDVTGEHGSPFGCLFRVPDEDLTFNVYAKGFRNIDRRRVCIGHLKTIVATTGLTSTTGYSSRVTRMNVPSLFGSVSQGSPRTSLMDFKKSRFGRTWGRYFTTTLHAFSTNATNKRFAKFPGLD